MSEEDARQQLANARNMLRQLLLSHREFRELLDEYAHTGCILPSHLHGSQNSLRSYAGRSGTGITRIYEAGMSPLPLLEKAIEALVVPIPPPPPPPPPVVPPDVVRYRQLELLAAVVGDYIRWIDDPGNPVGDPREFFASIRTAYQALRRE